MVSCLSSQLRKVNLFLTKTLSFKVQMKCFFLLLNLKEQQKSGGPLGGGAWSYIFFEVKISHHLTQNYSVQFQLKVALVSSHCLIITMRIKLSLSVSSNSAWRDGSLQGSCYLSSLLLLTSSVFGRLTARNCPQ